MQTSKILHQIRDRPLCKNSCVLSTHQPKTLTRELPEVEDGENTVLLLWLLVKAENDPSNAKTLHQNKPAAILAKEYASQNPLGAWDLKSGRSLEPNLVVSHEVSERVVYFPFIFAVNKLVGDHIAMAGARARVIFRQVSYPPENFPERRMIEDDLLCIDLCACTMFRSVSAIGNTRSVCKHSCKYIHVFWTILKLKYLYMSHM